MKNILLINPIYELEIRWIVDEEEIEAVADYLPLGLATVRALTPNEFHIDIWDEIVKGRITDETQFDTQYDLVGTTSCRANLPRAIELSRIFQRRAIPVAIGGPGVSGTPDRCRNHFDIMFIGEAELTWPQFLRDWQSGSYKKEYRQIEKPELSFSPPPQWDCFAPYLKKYAQGCVQTTRGCPFDCEFCDVVYLNGRRLRHKPISQVLEEIITLERLGLSSIFFNDDNFVGDRKYTKELLRELIPLNNSFAKPLRYATQASIDTSRDEELMELLADANFYQLVIGLETPNKESLKETGKFQNLKGDLVEMVRKIHSYGIVVRGALVVGFDHDDVTIFDKQYEFIQKACLPSVSLHMLNAPIGTRLWRRLRIEGRVIETLSITQDTTQRLFNNVIPKRMTHVELMQGFRELYGKVFSWDSFRERMICFVSQAVRIPKVRQEKVDVEKVVKAMEALNLDPLACEDMEEIFRHTTQKAPHMLGRIKEMVIQFVRYAKSAHEFMLKFERQIELESSGQRIFELDKRPVPVSNGFRDTYKSIFPDIHRRVYLNMDDKSQVPAALVEIFVELLIREEGIAQLEDYHRALLDEIIDKTCMRFSGKPPEDYWPVEASDELVPDAKKLRLDEDVLKSVEQELIKLVMAKTEAEVVQTQSLA